MGMYVSIRGWIELRFEQRAAVEEIIARHDDQHCSGGWGFPPELRGQLEEIAALPPVDVTATGLMAYSWCRMSAGRRTCG
jgi:hypothetical protein